MNIQRRAQKAQVLTLVLFVLLCGPTSTIAQTDQLETLKQLLAMPAPRPPRLDQTTTKPGGLNPEKAPADDAPIEDLIEYWTVWANHSAVLTDQVKERLLDAAVTDFDVLTQLIRRLPTHEAAQTKIKEAYDKAVNTRDVSDPALAVVRNWLVYNTKFFSEELLAIASKARDSDRHERVEHEESVIALAEVNWEVAEPLLRRLSTSAQVRSAALALSLYYKHAVESQDATAIENYRALLKTYALAKHHPYSARFTAIQALSSTEWSGRDEWYLSMFQDASLLDSESGVTPLNTILASDPDKWVPILTRFVESKDMTARSAAANALITFQSKLERKDAIAPLLPWLSNPQWARDTGGHRMRLVQSMALVDLPESVPGLIWVVENEFDSGDVKSQAALSLARYKDPRAIPALKKALSKEKNEFPRRLIIKGLLACHGLSESEQVRAFEAYAARILTSGNEVIGDLPVELAIGKYLSEQEDVSDTLVQSIIARADYLKSENPTVAQSMIRLAHRWQGRQIALDMIARISAGTADSKTITEALERREALRYGLRQELYALAAASGPVQGIGAALLDDAILAQGVLTGADQPAQIALLACSRLTRALLPVELVGPLLQSKNSLVALAAERYLLVEDSKEAQKLLWQHHPNQAFTTGWGERNDLPEYFSGMGKTEDKLRAELLKDNGPMEIIALIGDEYRNNSVLRIYPDKAVFTNYEDATRYRERTITKAELTNLKEFLATKGVAEMGAQFYYCHHGCVSELFLAITKEKGRRVFSIQELGGWLEIREAFESLGRGSDAKLHYNPGTEIKGLEVLYADKGIDAIDVWKQGDEIRILLEHGRVGEVAEEDLGDPDEEDEITRAARWRRAVARDNARFSWYVLANNKAGAVTTQPEIYTTIDRGKFPPYDDMWYADEDDRQTQKLTPNSIIFTRRSEGLWKQLAGAKPVQLGNDEGYSDPLVTPDNKWVVVSKLDGGDSSILSHIVRYNLQTGREFRVNVESANYLTPVAFVAPHNRVLLRRAKAEHEDESPGAKEVGPDRAEYYLLDPATGDVKLVTGEFGPLRQKGPRFLQPSDKPNECWAAISDLSRHQTRVGRYNLKDFSFKPVITIPKIYFDSMSMWVDVSQKKLYVIYKGQVLRLPLQLEP